MNAQEMASTASPRTGSPPIAMARRRSELERCSLHHHHPVIEEWRTGGEAAASSANRRPDSFPEASPDDDRRRCLDCRNYRPGRCLKPRAALMPAQIAPALASLPQRCPAFEPNVSPIKGTTP